MTAGRAERVQLSEIAGRYGELGDRIKDHLHSRSLRATPSRLAIVAALASTTDTASTEDHLSVRALLRALKSDGLRIDETTVYRTIDTLVELGLVHSVVIAGRATRFGLDDPAHHHAICDKCGTLRSIPAPTVDDLVASAGVITDIRPRERGALTLYGKCAGCR